MSKAKIVRVLKDLNKTILSLVKYEIKENLFWNVLVDFLYYFIFVFLKYAPLGDLSSNIGEAGLGELYSKRVAAQVAAALGYIHSKVTYLALYSRTRF